MLPFLPSSCGLCVLTSALFGCAAFPCQGLLSSSLVGGAFTASTGKPHQVTSTICCNFMTCSKGTEKQHHPKRRAERQHHPRGNGNPQEGGRWAANFKIKKLCFQKKHSFSFFKVKSFMKMSFCFSFLLRFKQTQNPMYWSIGRPYPTDTPTHSRPPPPPPPPITHSPPIHHHKLHFIMTPSTRVRASRARRKPPLSRLSSIQWRRRWRRKMWAWQWLVQTRLCELGCSVYGRFGPGSVSRLREAIRVFARCPFPWNCQ